MTDLFSWCPITLGRWSGTLVRIHIFLIIFVLFRLFGAAIATPEPAPEVADAPPAPVEAPTSASAPADEVPRLAPAREPAESPADAEATPPARLTVGQTAAWLILLLVALAVHELGHGITASRLGDDIEEIRLWPLGNFLGPAPPSPSRFPENLVIALAGPATSATVALVSAIVLSFAGATMVLNPFGHPGTVGAPTLASGQTAEPFTAVWLLGWFGYLNWVLFLANLIPALPMDGGRALRAYLNRPTTVPTRDSMIAPWTGRTCAAILVLVALFRFSYDIGQGLTLIALAILFELMVRAEIRLIEDGTFLDDGVFGYDFSEGYTSLEGSGPKVRPSRESALKRWRRRRSEQRRQRQLAREAAEEQRMDAILEKLHREGRASLSDEEYRFLVRVSVRYRSKPRAHD